MSALDTVLHAPTVPAAVGASIRSAGPAMRLLAAVALASAVTGGLATLALEHLLGATPPRQLAPAVPAKPWTAAPPAPGLPAVHDVLRDRAEPPIEPPPAS